MGLATRMRFSGKRAWPLWAICIILALGGGFIGAVWLRAESILHGKTAVWSPDRKNKLYYREQQPDRLFLAIPPTDNIYVFEDVPLVLSRGRILSFRWLDRAERGSLFQRTSSSSGLPQGVLTSRLR